MKPSVTMMVPVLLGSTRVPDKNLLLVDGKVLCSYVIRSSIESEAFDEIMINSEDQVFEPIARDEGISFHKRPPEWGGSKCQQKTKSRTCQSTRCSIN